jgi:hypothetical protein
MDRKEFLVSSIKAAATGFALSCCSSHVSADSGKTQAPPCADRPGEPTCADAAFLRRWLSDFVAREEPNLDRADAIKLLEERGRACCRALDFRQKLIRNSNGSLEKLVELMGNIVGPQNCRLEGNTVTLIYPVKQCVCGWSPKRALPDPREPYCDCSKANNQHLFETVTGKKVHAEIVESPRRTGSPCKFILQVA